MAASRSRRGSPPRERGRGRAPTGSPRGKGAPGHARGRLRPGRSRLPRPAGVREVLIDVNVGLPRCGCDPGEAGWLADLARSLGLTGPRGDGLRGSCRRPRGCIRARRALPGVDGAARAGARRCRGRARQRRRHRDVRLQHVGDRDPGRAPTLSWMSPTGDSGLPFRQALFVEATVISSGAKWSVADAGLKAFGMDRGNPEMEGANVWFCSDEHVTFDPPRDVGRPESASARPRRSHDGLPRAGPSRLGR